MPSIRIIYDVDGWAFHNRALALQKYAPADFDVTIAPLGAPADVARALGDTPVDLLLFLPESPIGTVAGLLRERGWRSKLVGCWSAGWPQALDCFYRIYELADCVIINNRIAWEHSGRLPRAHMLANGVDLEVFRLTAPIEERTPKVLWLGSRRAGRIKGYDRVIVPLEERLRRLGIACEFRLVDSTGDGKSPPRAMAEWYNSGTVLVCASAAEGTPNPALEAAACGCTVVSTAVGNMPELIRDGENGYLVERNVEALLAGVRAACDNYGPLARAMQRDIRAWHWRLRSQPIFDLCRRVLAGGRAAVRKPDIGGAVTVFVSTVGAASFDACQMLLREQDSDCAVEIIRDVAPMNAAFQRMVDRCTTPFYVQVDEDMLLYPHAVRTLHDAISGDSDDVAMVVADLHDPHLGRTIQGVKVFRHATVARYPLADVQSFEKRQVAHMRADGHRIRHLPVTLGLHGTHWTARSIYERYRTLETRRRAHPRDLGWFEPYHALFLERFQEDPSELNFFALMGVLAGRLVENGERGADKDYRRYDRLPGFAALRNYFDECVSGDTTRRLAK